MGNQAFEALKAAVKSDKALLDKLSDHTEMGDAAEALAGIAKARGTDGCYCMCTGKFTESWF